MSYPPLNTEATMQSPAEPRSRVMDQFVSSETLGYDADLK
jgi:hypothetical protein